MAKIPASKGARKGARKNTPKKVESIKHGQTRPNNPSIEMESIVPDQPQPVFYARNRDLDPQLCWTGKDEENEGKLHIDAVPIYVQEKIHPQVLINDLKQQSAQKRSEQPGAMADMFSSDFNGIKDEAARVEFYQHKQKWTNRLILGDSLMVMASLAHKEGLKGQVQCIYMDPPYGIKFGSNWQPSTKKVSVKDKDETREPEMIQAFRDTWKLGTHSYLSYLRDRLTVARDLLAESGSVFVQISDKNMHLVRCLMDEIFGAENFMSNIGYRTKSPLGTNYLGNAYDFVLWYCKNKTAIKYRNIFNSKTPGTNPEYSYIDTDNGIKSISEGMKDASFDMARVFSSQSPTSSGRTESCVFDFEYRGSTYSPGGDKSWSTNVSGMDIVAKSGRLYVSGNNIRYKYFLSDFPVSKYSNIWADTYSESNRVYVVQTSQKVIERCLLMTTDPGDLVLDPTCGSGTTATVAEQWGRRWITVDTSRVALAIARARLMGNEYDYYLMQDSEEGAKMEQVLSGNPASKKEYTDDIRHGFVYERVPHVTLGDIANNREIGEIWDKWQGKLNPLQAALNKALGENHEEWEIPLQAGDDWSSDAKETHAQWLTAKRKRQQEIDVSIAANANTELLVDRPYTANNTVRVTGPFTVESLSPHRVLPTDDRDDVLLNAAATEAEQEGEAASQPSSRRLRAKSQTENEANFMQVIYDNLKAAGVQNTRKKERLIFSEIEPWQGSKHIQFCGYYEENGKNKRAAICVGPEYGTVTRSHIIAAARQAADMFDIVLVLGFAFEAYADTRMMNIGKMEVLKIRLNTDLHMGDRLKETGNSNLFVVFGEPDIEMRPLDGDMIEVEIKGVDIFDPTTGETKPSGVKDIACWMIDTNYNEESFFARHIYFTGGGKDPYKQLKRTLNAEIDKDEWESLYKGTSRPFPKPETGRIAVKAINHYGDEVIKVFEVGE